MQMLLLLTALLAQSPADDVKAAVQKTGEAAYTYEVAGRFKRTGEWLPNEVLSARIAEFQSARFRNTILVKGPEGLWKTPGERIGEATENQKADVEDIMKVLEEAQPPHRMAGELAAAAIKVSQSGETDLPTSGTCRILWIVFNEERIKKELKDQLDEDVKRGKMKKPDTVLWPSMSGSARVYVRKEDGRIARITEQYSLKIQYRPDPEQRPDEKTYKLEMTFKLSDFGATKLELPVEVKERLGVKEK